MKKQPEKFSGCLGGQPFAQTLHGAAVRCTDLRGGAALCVAALAAEGKTHISETGHIDRGYQDIVGDLRALGADIARIETED